MKLSQSQNRNLGHGRGKKTCELNLSQSENRNLGHGRGRRTCELNLSRSQNHKLGHGRGGDHVNLTCHKVRIEIWATVGVGKHVN